MPSRDHINDLRPLITEGSLHVRGDGSYDDDAFLAFGTDRSKQFAPDFHVLVFPGSTAETARLVKFCNERKLNIVPSGGRTGLAGGAVATRDEIVVSFAKMNRITGFDPHLPALLLEAGVITKIAQNDAAERGYLFPLDLAAAGSSFVGGNVATNAGGLRVIRLGMLRDYVAGMTVVTGAGEILTFPGTILKNNTGVDLKQLFIGSEGTLGLITELTIRLAPRPRAASTALFAVPGGPAAALEFLGALRKHGIAPFAFEFFDAASVDAVRKHLDLAEPFGEQYDWYVLVEWDAAETDDDALLELFQSLTDDGILAGVRLALNSAQVNELWKYREGISESLSLGYTVRKHDLSIPLAEIDGFVRTARALLAPHAENVRGVFFGHLGDGNVHLNLIKARDDLADEDFHERCRDLEASLYEITAKLRGSVSAEHGIGLLKKEQLHHSRSPEELRLMRALKQVFDPAGVLNPGKILQDV